MGINVICLEKLTFNVTLMGSIYFVYLKKVTTVNHLSVE